MVRVNTLVVIVAVWVRCGGALKHAHHVVSVSRGGDADDGSGESADDGDDLSGEELAESLAAVREHYAQRAALRADEPPEAAVEEAAIVRRTLLCTRFDELRLARCAVRPSSLHGAGVFATRALLKGELITLYPGDAVLTDSTELNSSHVAKQAHFGEHVGDEERLTDGFFLRSARATGYEITAFPREGISMVGDPRRGELAAYLGHFANDGAYLASPDIEKRDTYNELSKAAANAEFLPIAGCHLGLFCSRDIAAGDEILVSYGKGYWLSRIEPTPEPQI